MSEFLEQIQSGNTYHISMTDDLNSVITVHVLIFTNNNNSIIKSYLVLIVDFFPYQLWVGNRSY